jgi:hypothetical protein
MDRYAGCKFATIAWANWYILPKQDTTLLDWDGWRACSAFMHVYAPRRRAKLGSNFRFFIDELRRRILLLLIGISRITEVWTVSRKRCTARLW